MQSSIIERIKYIKKTEKLTNDVFSNKTTVPLETIKSMFSKKTNPNIETLQKIISAFPHYSIEWLVMGFGDPFKEKSGKEIIQDIEGRYIDNNELYREYSVLKRLKGSIEYLTLDRNTYSISQIAADLDMTPQTLNKKLEEMGVIRKENGVFILCDKYLGNKYQKPHTYPAGEHHLIDYMKWTMDGRLFILSLFPEITNSDTFQKNTKEDRLISLGKEIGMLEQKNKTLEQQNETLRQEIYQMKRSLRSDDDNANYTYDEEEIRIVAESKPK